MNNERPVSEINQGRAARRDHRTMTVRQRILSQRYHQRDLHDARRVAERWWEMLRTNARVGLSDQEQDVRRACAVIMTRIRLDATGNYRLTTPQLKLFDEDNGARST